MGLGWLVDISYRLGSGGGSRKRLQDCVGARWPMRCLSDFLGQVYRDSVPAEFAVYFVAILLTTLEYDRRQHPMRRNNAKLTRIDGSF